jgi:lambda repressor-like predicted transcriptional regulator
MLSAFAGGSPWVVGLPHKFRGGLGVDPRRRGRTDGAHAPAGAGVGSAAQTSASASAEWGGLSMDALDSFTEVAWRAQEQICADTAAFDGLGTYEDVADAACAPQNDPRATRWCGGRYLPRSRRPHRAMAGGRAFAAAFVDVFDSRGVVRPRVGNGGGGDIESKGRDKDSVNETSRFSDNAERRFQERRNATRRTGHDTTRSRILTRLHKHTGSVSHKSDGAGLSVRLVPRNPAMPALNAT